MATFTPPANASENPPVLPENTPAEAALFKYMRSRPVGRNVFIYSNGTVSEVDPDGVTTFWQQAEGSPYVTGRSPIAAVFYGGHDSYAITPAQDTLLTNAGYTTTP